MERSSVSDLGELLSGCTTASYSEAVKHISAIPPAIFKDVLSSEIVESYALFDVLDIILAPNELGSIFAPTLFPNLCKLFESLSRQVSRSEFLDKNVKSLLACVRVIELSARSLSAIPVLAPPCLSDPQQIPKDHAVQNPQPVPQDTLRAILQIIKGLLAFLEETPAAGLSKGFCEFQLSGQPLTLAAACCSALFALLTSYPIFFPARLRALASAGTDLYVRLVPGSTEALYALRALDALLRVSEARGGPAALPVQALLVRLLMFAPLHERKREKFCEHEFLHALAQVRARLGAAEGTAAADGPVLHSLRFFKPRRLASPLPLVETVQFHPFLDALAARWDAAKEVRHRLFRRSAESLERGGARARQRYSVMVFGLSAMAQLAADQGTPHSYPEAVSEVVAPRTDLPDMPQPKLGRKVSTLANSALFPTGVSTGGLLPAEAIENVYTKRAEAVSHEKNRELVPSNFPFESPFATPFVHTAYGIVRPDAAARPLAGSPEALEALLLDANRRACESLHGVCSNNSPQHIQKLAAADFPARGEPRPAGASDADETDSFLKEHLEPLVAAFTARSKEFMTVAIESVLAPGNQFWTCLDALPIPALDVAQLSHLRFALAEFSPSSARSAAAACLADLIAMCSFSMSLLFERFHTRPKLFDEFASSCVDFSAFFSTSLTAMEADAEVRARELYQQFEAVSRRQAASHCFSESFKCELQPVRHEYWSGVCPFDSTSLPQIAAALSCERIVFAQLPLFRPVERKDLPLKHFHELALRSVGCDGTFAESGGILPTVFPSTTPLAPWKNAMLTTRGYFSAAVLKQVRGIPKPILEEVVPEFLSSVSHFLLRAVVSSPKRISKDARVPRVLVSLCAARALCREGRRSLRVLGSKLIDSSISIKEVMTVTTVQNRGMEVYERMIPRPYFYKFEQQPFSFRRPSRDAMTDSELTDMSEDTGVVSMTPGEDSSSDDKIQPVKPEEMLNPRMSRIFGDGKDSKRNSFVEYLPMCLRDNEEFPIPPSVPEYEFEAQPSLCSASTVPALSGSPYFKNLQLVLEQSTSYPSDILRWVAPEVPFLSRPFPLASSMFALGAVFSNKMRRIFRESDELIRNPSLNGIKRRSIRAQAHEQQNPFNWTGIVSSWVSENIFVQANTPPSLSDFSANYIPPQLLSRQFTPSDDEIMALLAALRGFPGNEHTLLGSACTLLVRPFSRMTSVLTIFSSSLSKQQTSSDMRSSRVAHHHANVSTRAFSGLIQHIVNNPIFPFGDGEPSVLAFADILLRKPFLAKTNDAMRLLLSPLACAERVFVYFPALLMSLKQVLTHGSREQAGGPNSKAIVNIAQLTLQLYALVVAYFSCFEDIELSLRLSQFIQKGASIDLVLQEASEALKAGLNLPIMSKGLFTTIVEKLRGEPTGAAPGGAAGAETDASRKFAQYLKYVKALALDNKTTDFTQLSYESFFFLSDCGFFPLVGSFGSGHIAPLRYLRSVRSVQAGARDIMLDALHFVISVVKFMFSARVDGFLSFSDAERPDQFFAQDPGDFCTGFVEPIGALLRGLASCFRRFHSFLVDRASFTVVHELWDAILETHRVIKGIVARSDASVQAAWHRGEAERLSRMRARFAVRRWAALSDEEFGETALFVRAPEEAGALDAVIDRLLATDPPDATDEGAQAFADAVKAARLLRQAQRDGDTEFSGFFFTTSFCEMLERLLVAFFYQGVFLNVVGTKMCSTVSQAEEVGFFALAHLQRLSKRFAF
eukprot:gnl/Chilomastix_cuspidata/4886.p1 GENE.gnl/Chilomastix_cuspidata/4886~~gnl/Chilomastix_cuspidata/4886.p1  ORF type:complete len:1742 (+),score=615.99 gnl/Chilomastix_cuspidata/4886:61-5286(+)